MEYAILKTTSVLAKEDLGIQDRGILAAGAFADVVVFDLNSMGEAGDYLHPILPPDGICQVLVNRDLVYENDRHTGERSGEVLIHIC